MRQALEKTHHAVVCRPERERGTTLLETSVVVSVLAVVLSTFGTALTRSQVAFTETLSAATLEQEARTALHKVIDELRFADPQSVALDATTDARAAQFESIEGWDGEATKSAQKTVRLSDGSIYLDSTPIAGGIEDLRMNLLDRTLTIEVDVQNSIVVEGQTRLFSRSLVADIRL